METYIVKRGMNEVYDLIHSAIKEKRNNLNGGISENGGFDITPNLVFGNLDPNAGHIAKVNMSAVNVSPDGQLCMLELKRIDGLTYKIHVGGAVGFVIITIVVIAIYALNNSKEFDWKILLMSLFGLFYLLSVKVFTNMVISNTKKRILKILSDNKINYSQK